MKITVGKKNDKHIETVIISNVLHGNTVYYHNNEYYCLALEHNNFYSSPDVQFYSIPDGLYVFKNGIPYLTQE